MRNTLAILFVAAVSFTATVPLLAQDAREAMDTSIKPGDDFYRYANGGWLRSATIPAGEKSYDDRTVLRDRTSQRVRSLMQQAAASGSSHGSLAQKVGDYYASFLDQQSIQTKGFAPLASDLSRIAGIADEKSLSAYLGSTLNTEIDGLINNADHVFGLFVNQGFADSKRNYPHILQGGLGLPDRETYLDTSTKAAGARAQYREHIATLLKLAGVTDPEGRAARVLELEVAIARSHAPDSDAADVFKQNNPWKRGDFAVKAPGIDWDSYFKAAGISDQSDFIIWQPTAVTGTCALVKSAALEDWKDYLRFHLVDHYASVLPTGAAPGEAQAREKAAIAATNGALDQAVGQLYTARYFPPQAKANAQAMAKDLITAYRGRIAKLTWMSPETKKKALAKLAAFTLGIGYPDKWLDYSSFDVVRGDAFGNMQRAEAFNRSLNIAQLNQPADPNEWRIEAQRVAAIIMFTPNSEFFSAGLLQPPFFDPDGDSAANYGSAGAGMAHEISHSFDELGNIYDAEGRLDKWWTAEDLSRYHAASAKLVEQFNYYCPFADACVNGKQVLGENIADTAGLLVAHDAYLLSLKGKHDVVIGGLTGEQRFFIAFAQRWRKLQDDAALRSQLATDTHAPGEYRSDTVRNVDAWYKAFNVTPADKLYVKPEDRVRIW
ncbi:MAG: M13 family metallopeptidase [Terriglobales bacterium]